MRFMLRLVSIGLLFAPMSGCTIAREPSGLAIHAAGWRLQDGSYRPWNDVNSGSLSPWISRRNPYAGLQPGLAELQPAFGWIP